MNPVSGDSRPLFKYPLTYVPTAGELRFPCIPMSASYILESAGETCVLQEETIMIRRSSEKNTVTKPAPFDGIGEITVRDLLNGPDEMEHKGRAFCHTTVHPGTQFGLHTHHGDAETYYILSGHGKYNDNGTVTDVNPGDVCYCGDGECHSIQAVDEPIGMISLILYTKD